MQPLCSARTPPSLGVGSICRGHDWPVGSPKEDSREGKREQGKKDRQTKSSAAAGRGGWIHTSNLLLQIMLHAVNRGEMPRFT